MFFAAILPQFVEPGAAAGAQMAVLGLVFVAIALVSDSAWGLLAGTARHWFRGSPHRLRRLSNVGGAVMIALGARLALASADLILVGGELVQPARSASGTWGRAPTWEMISPAARLPSSAQRSSGAPIARPCRKPEA